MLKLLLTRLLKFDEVIRQILESLIQQKTKINKLMLKEIVPFSITPVMVRTNDIHTHGFGQRIPKIN